MTRKVKKWPSNPPPGALPDSVRDSEVAGGEATQRSSKGGKSGGGMGGQRAGGVKGGGKRKTHVGRKKSR